MKHQAQATVIDAIYHCGGAAYLALQRGRRRVIRAIAPVQRAVAVVEEVPSTLADVLADEVSRFAARIALRRAATRDAATEGLAPSRVREGMWRAADVLDRVAAKVNDATCALAQVLGADEVARIRAEVADARARDLAEIDAGDEMGEITIGGGQ